MYNDACHVHCVYWQGLVNSEGDTTDAYAECDHSLHTGHIALLQGFSLQSTFFYICFKCTMYMYVYVQKYVYTNVLVDICFLVSTTCACCCSLLEGKDALYVLADCL